MGRSRDWVGNWRERVQLGVPHIIRLGHSPTNEIRRLGAYAFRPRRRAFLDFQRKYALSQLNALRSMHVNADSGSGRVNDASELEVREPTPQGQSLGELLAHYGSDKSTVHDYDRIYSRFEQQRGQPRLVVEIGLGTSAPGPSSMGPHGHPGASARAFRDWGALVIGADIDPGTLFREQGIRTIRVDQLVPSSLRKLAEFSAHYGPIDLAVIDGLHSPEADLNSILALAPCLSTSGLLVVEDIEPVPPILAIWRLILGAVPQHFVAHLVRTRQSFVCLLGRATYWNEASLRSLY